MAPRTTRSNQTHSMPRVQSLRKRLSFENTHSDDAVIAVFSCTAACHNAIGSTSASPTACPLRGYGRAGTQNDRLGERRSF